MLGRKSLPLCAQSTPCFTLSSGQQTLYFMPPLKTLNLIENKTGRKNVVVSRHRFHLKSGAFIFIKYLKMAEKGATPKTYCRRDVVFNVYVDINNEILRKMNKVYCEGVGRKGGVVG